MKGVLTGMACIAKERGELEEGEDSENFGREEGRGSERKGQRRDILVFSHGSSTLTR